MATGRESTAVALDAHRGCKLRVDRIYNNATPAIGVECYEHGVVATFELPTQRRVYALEVEVQAWWPEDVPDRIDIAEGIEAALPAEWTDPTIGDEFWIEGINPVEY